ncbi:7,8-dihydroneopterin aldolase [Microbacterium nanhaiense]|uniref:7,8-dihydroneopterin aldolase n=1 Tax=Microbacterium nanhaiense TaxID=1301026 RepID=A0ABQ2N0G2_9MICO|nr:dihydroneopterin aldolase [Microbacterium nanhaiense]GGO62038.1 7,8-dihydroneopterin aldolase [Microbacterium nanhaiense]
MTDTITLTGLVAYGYHGVFEHEKRDGQEFTIDVSLDVDTRRAAASDDIADTVHYGELADAVVRIVTGERFDLIETLADRLAAAVMEDERVLATAVTVHKPHAPIPHAFADVSVTARRTRSGA